MIDVRETVEFAAWVDGLRDLQTRRRMSDRLLRVAEGRFGDVKALGDGVSELRFHFGPGYRVYFTRLGVNGSIPSCSPAVTRTSKRATSR